MKLKPLGTLVVAGTLFSGCATIMSGGSHELFVSTHPSGAEVKVGGAVVCASTPCKVKVDKSSESKMLTVSKSGYEDSSIMMSSAMDPWLLGNIIFGGVFGTTTDAATGSMYKYDKNSVNIELHQK